MGAWVKVKSFPTLIPVAPGMKGAGSSACEMTSDARFPRRGALARLGRPILPTSGGRVVAGITGRRGLEMGSSAVSSSSIVLLRQRLRI